MTGHRGPRGATPPRGPLFAVAALLVVGALVAYVFFLRGPAMPPAPPMPTYRTAEGGVRIAVFDLEAMREWCASQDLPDPPGLPEAEGELANSLLGALHDAASDRSGETLGLVGMICESLESHGAARQYFELAAAQAPADHRWPYYIGCIEQLTGNVEEAAARFRRAMQINAVYPVTYARLGHIELDLGNLDEAARLLGIYTERAPRDWLGLVGSGRIALRRGDAEGALGFLQRAVERGGDDFQVHRILGRIHGALGNREEAGRHFAISSERPQGAWYRFRDPLDEALHRSASSVSSLEAEFERRSAAQDWPELVRLAEEILRRRAGDVTMMGNLAGLYRKAKRFDEAHQVLDRAFRVGTHELRLHGLRAEVRLAENDFPGAIAAAEEALKLDPDAAGPHGVRARALLMQGLPAEAEAAMRRSLELQPEDAPNLVVLGEILLQTGDLDGAEAAYRASLRLSESGFARQRIARIGEFRASEANSP